MFASAFLCNLSIGKFTLYVQYIVFIVQLYCIYYLYYFLLRCSSDCFADIVQLYSAYYLYYCVLRVISDLCAAYFYYFSDMKKIPRVLVPLTQLVPATASCCPLTLKSQFLCSRSGRPTSTVNRPELPCNHFVHPTNQSFQAWPSKTFVNQLAKCCDPVPYFSSDFLILQSLFELTRQAPWDSTVIPQQITCTPNPFLNWHTKHYDPVQSFSSSYLPLQDIF